MQKSAVFAPQKPTAGEGFFSKAPHPGPKTFLKIFEKVRVYFSTVFSFGRIPSCNHTSTVEEHEGIRYFLKTAETRTQPFTENIFKIFETGSHPDPKNS